MPNKVLSLLALAVLLSSCVDGESVAGVDEWQFGEGFDPQLPWPRLVPDGECVMEYSERAGGPVVGQQRWIYDERARLVSHVDRELGDGADVRFALTYVYDDGDRVIERRSQRYWREAVVVDRFEYDGDRLAGSSHFDADGIQSHRTYIYDRHGRLARVDHRRHSASEVTGHVRYTYDDVDGTVLVESFSAESPQVTGRTLTRYHPDGRVDWSETDRAPRFGSDERTSYKYDVRRRLVEKTYWNLEQDTLTARYALAYDQDDRLESFTADPAPLLSIVPPDEPTARITFEYAASGELAGALNDHYMDGVVNQVRAYSGQNCRFELLELEEWAEGGP